MQRVIEPLAQIGARFVARTGGRLPLAIEGAREPLPIAYAPPVPSAQVKSAVLLAGLNTPGETSVIERAPTRDHSERLLTYLGASLRREPDPAGGQRITLTGQPELTARPISVPADPSSAAFLVAAGLLRTVGAVRLASVGVNPTRTGFLRVLARMGARIEVEEAAEAFGEPTGTLVARGGPLRGTVVTAGEIPGLIDEVPVLAALASRARGETVFREVGELRVKESDRLALVAANLRAIGAGAEVQGEDLVVAGGMEGPPRGRVRTAGDHRLAMAFGVLGTLPGARVGIDDRACAAVSFPGFWDLLQEATR